MTEKKKSRITISDLGKDAAAKITEEELRRVSGGGVRVGSYDLRNVNKIRYSSFVRERASFFEGWPAKWKS